MTGKKKSGIALKRRQFLLALAAVCLIAVIAEAVLLIRTFSKKNNKKTAEITPTEIPKVAQKPTDTPSPTPELEPAFTTVWRLAKEKTTYSDGTLSNCYSYEYDDQGREIKRIIYGSDGVTPEETVLFHQDRSGVVITEHWVPDENGTLREKKCFFLTCSGVSIDSLWKQNLYLGSGEILTSCEYDENGNLTGELKGYHQFLDDPPYHSTVTINAYGQLVSHVETGPDGEVTGNYSFQYDNLGRLTDIIRNDDDGPREHIAYRYEDDLTYVLMNSEEVRGYIYKDGVEVGLFCEYGDADAWERMSREYDPDRSIVVGYEMWYHFPKGSFPHNAESFAREISGCDYTVYSEGMTARLLTKTECRDDGQPLREIFSADGMEDVRIASSLKERNFEYGDNGRVSRIESSEGIVTMAFDTDGNMIQYNNDFYGFKTDYEWAAIPIALY